MRTNVSKFTLALSLFGASLVVQALQIISLSPQGEVSQVRQIVAKFDKSAILFGDPKALPPLDVKCKNTSSITGNGRWISDREWAYEFSRDLPSGVSCELQSRLGFKSPQGEALTTQLFKFTTGGPFVENIRPSLNSIEEDQKFLLQLNGPATAQSIQEKVWCETDDLGERIPVKFVSGSDREEILKATGLTKEAKKEPLAFVTLSCNRRLSSGVKWRIVFGKGVLTPSGVVNTVEKRFPFEVQPPFKAEFSCERENAQAACLPIRPVSLGFSSPISRKVASEIRLKSDSATFKPVFSKDESDDAQISTVQFATVMPERTQFKIILPDDFKDISGRKLANIEEFPLNISTGPMPPLAKFAASPFGIIERFAEPDGVAMMPLTLRNVESTLPLSGLAVGGKISDLHSNSDAKIIKWYRKVLRYQQYTVDRTIAAKELRLPLPPVIKREGWNSKDVETRAISLLSGENGVKTLDLPKPENKDPRPFEVVGVPLKPGFHVLEIASQKLGSTLLNSGYGKNRTMFVRTSALVTNLGVHF